MQQNNHHGKVHYKAMYIGDRIVHRMVFLPQAYILVIPTLASSFGSICQNTRTHLSYSGAVLAMRGLHTTLCT